MKTAVSKSLGFCDVRNPPWGKQNYSMNYLLKPRNERIVINCASH